MYRNDSNASTASQRTDSNVAPRLETQRQPRYRSRDFGIGYGASSGYAGRSGYAPSQPAPRFRLV
jgi:hypothetical protein